MKNLGLKPERELCECGPVSCTHMREIEYPTAYLNADQMPELHTLDVGDEILLTVKARVRSISKREMIAGTECSGSLDLLAYKVNKETD